MLESVKIDPASLDVLDPLESDQITEDDIVTKIRDLQKADEVFTEDAQELLNKIIRENKMDLDIETQNCILKQINV